MESKKKKKREEKKLLALEEVGPTSFSWNGEDGVGVVE